MSERHDAAGPPGIRLAELTTRDEHITASKLLAAIWGADNLGDIVEPGLMRAFWHSGNYVVGAFDGEAMIAAAVGFIGDGHLHSHVTGVLQRYHRSGVGLALKMHQRAWALDRGIPQIQWTFDPLVARNARFNLHKLGARFVEYLPDFYGPMVDAVNAGDTSDRLLVEWNLRSPAATAAAAGSPVPDPARDRSARIVLDRHGDEAAAATPATTSDTALLVALPRDIEKLRVTDMSAAKRWRTDVCRALSAAMAAGFEITAVHPDAWYYLERTDETDRR